MAGRGWVLRMASTLIGRGYAWNRERARHERLGGPGHLDNRPRSIVGRPGRSLRTDPDASVRHVERAAGAPASWLLVFEQIDGRAASVWERADGTTMWEFVPISRGHCSPCSTGDAPAPA